MDFDHFLISSDLNVHVCCETSSLVKDFLSLIDSFNLTQWVSGLPHDKGHTLDLVLSHGLSICVSEICNSACISAHFPVIFSATVPCSVVAARPPARCFRATNSSTTLQFSTAFNGYMHSTVEGYGALSAEDLVALFNSTCTSILDAIAPLSIKRPKAISEPWINDSICALRRSCRRAERRWKKDKLHVSVGILQECLLEYHKAVKAAKTAYISHLVSNNIDKPKVLFNVLDSLVNPRDTAPIVPTPALCNDFLNFLLRKSLLFILYLVLLSLIPLTLPCAQLFLTSLSLYHCPLCQI